MTARDLARRVLARVDKGAWASHALDGELERSGLEPRDRRLAAELVYGVLRHRSRLDRALARYADLKKTPPAVRIALRVAAYQLLFLRVPAHAAVDDAVAAARATGAKLAGFANAVLRRLAEHGEPALPQDPRERAEVEHSMPGWLLELAPVENLAALNAPAPLWARVNLARASRDDVAQLLTTEGAEVAPGPTPASLRVSGLGEVGASPSFKNGLWTVQDLGAQKMTLLAEPSGHRRILDACAGVGGKSTYLAELAPGAQIDAADLSAQKLRLAADTAKRLGHTLRTIQGDLLDPKLPLADHYDLVLLDAPCSGLGVLRRHPEAKWRLAPEDIPRLAALQAQLLDVIAPRVAPGGTLVYGVCTFTAAEGADQAKAFEARHPEFIREAELRTWPHEDGADAFFAVRYKRAGAEGEPRGLEREARGSGAPPRRSGV